MRLTNKKITPKATFDLFKKINCYEYVGTNIGNEFVKLIKDKYPAFFKLNHFLSDFEKLNKETLINMYLDLDNLLKK